MGVKRLLVVVVLAVSLLVRPAPAAAQAAVASQLLGRVASGVLGHLVGEALSDLGIFSVFGLGGGSDPVINAKLDQIINQLQVIQTDVTDLKADVATLTNTVIAQANLIQLQALLHDMDDAATRIQLCAQQVTLVAQSPGTDATDQQMHAFALQMVGRQAGPCDLTNQFSIIHARIVTNQVLGGAQSAFYDLLARAARDNRIEYERVASHFIQYAIIQREALDLIRGAYTLLGEAANLETVFTQPPSDFLNKLRDEEVAFLVATDTYITAGSPPYDTAPAALADAIVQRLERVPSQATTFSLSILDDAVALTPVLTPYAGSTAAPIPLYDKVMGATTSYYALPHKALTAGIGSCLASPPSDGFSYTRPIGGPGGGFKIGSSCALHLERHLAKNPPALLAADWSVNRRRQSLPVGAARRRNAATMKDETAADALALAGDRAGRAGLSAFTLVPDATNPDRVTLAIDLPGQPATPIAPGTAHAFVALPGGAAVPFTRVPFGPLYPDRYALQAAAGTYLSVGAGGFAALAATPTWFELRPLPDGRVELDYGAGVVYVDSQFRQYHWAESPDDVWANGPNLAAGAAAIAQWTVPSDGIPRPPIPVPMSIYPACIDGNGRGTLACENIASLCVSSTYCARAGVEHFRYLANFVNQDNFARAFRLTLASRAVQPQTVSTGTVAAVRCNNRTTGGAFWETAGANVTPPAISADSAPVAYTVMVPANGNLLIQCWVADQLGGAPARLDITGFTVQPCKGTAGGTCVVYP